MKNLKFIALSITGALALASCQQPVTPTNKAPVAAFSANTNQLVTSVSDASNDPDGIADIASYSWNWGDGSTASTGKTPGTHTYAAAGNYTIILTVTDKGGLTSIANQSVTATAPVVVVNKAPVAAFSASTNKLVTSVSDASNDPDGIADIASYSWNWGDGSAASTGKAPGTHTYAAAGNYTVTLTVTDKGGLTSSTSQTVVASATDVIVNQSPVAIFSINANKLVATVSDASIDPNGAADIVSYSWNWGDGSAASAGKDPGTHTYAAAGSYTVTLTVTDKGGLTSTTTRTLTIAAEADLRPSVVVNSINKTQTTTTVSFTTNALPGTSIVSCKLDGNATSVPVTIGASNYLGILTLSNLTPATTYPLTLTCTSKDGAGKTYDTTSAFSVTTDAVPVVVLPNPNGGGNNGVGNGAFDISSAAQIIKTANINVDNQFRFAVIDQKVTVAGVNTSIKLLYVRGTFDLSKDMTTLSGVTGQTALPNETVAGVEYYLSNTVTNATNKISGKVNTNGLAQGQQYLLAARRRNADGSLTFLADLAFIPDNKGPEVPKIVPVSKLQSATLTSTYGNWVNGKFTQQLINGRTLEDQPQPTGNGVSNPQNNVERPASGFASLLYLAYPVSSDNLGGDPGQYLPLDASGNYDLSKAIVLGSVLTNGDSINNFSQDIFTARKANANAVLGDGDYVIFAVAFDNLGNYNKIDFQDSYILGVDNTPPTGNIRAVDRGPLDVNATGLECSRVNTDITTNKAPSDIMVALPGYISGCGLVSAAVSDVGIGFDYLGVLGITYTVGSIAAPVGINGPGGLQIGGIDSQNSAHLSTAVWNVNGIQGLQILRGQVSDLLGNVGKIYSDPIVIDNRSPSVTLDMNSANGTNSFTAGQSVGVGAQANDNGTTYSRANLDTLIAKINAEVAASVAAGNDPESATGDSLINGNSGNLGVVSGPRAQFGSDGLSIDNFTKNKNIAYYYGTSDLDFNPGSPKAYNNMLMQISPAYVEDLRNDQIGGLFSSRANFNIPDPANGRGAAVSHPLDIWALGVDAAGNAGVAKYVADVTQPTKNSRPVISQDIGIVEDGQNLVYSGFTVLPRTSNGNVAQLTHDFADPYEPLATFGLSRLNTPNNRVVEYTDISGGFYELRVQNGNNDGITFNGNINNTQGIGALSFIYRLPDPINPKVGASLFGVNPSIYWSTNVLAYRALDGSIYNRGTTPIGGLGGFPFNSKSNCESAVGNGVKCALLLNFPGNTTRYSNAAAMPNFGGTLGEADFTDNVADPRGVVFANGVPAFYPVIVAHANTTLANVERKGRFFYNVPGWFGAQGDFQNGNFGAALTPNQRIWSIWNNISDAQKAPFVSVFNGGLKGLAIPDDLGASNQNFGPSVGSATPARPYYKQFALGVVAFNNYGQADAQVKRE